MFGSITTLRQSIQSSFHQSPSTSNQEVDCQKCLGTQTSEFSLNLQPSNDKLCTKLSKVTKCTLASQSLDSDSGEEKSEERFVTFDSKTEQCQGYFNRMCCDQGEECMFSHSRREERERKGVPSFSLFRLLEEYPELALIRGRQRQYSMFFN